MNETKPNLTTIKLGGKTYHCHCGANVFRKPRPGVYQCNACGEEYEGE